MVSFLSPFRDSVRPYTFPVHATYVHKDYGAMLMSHGVTSTWKPQNDNSLQMVWIVLRSYAGQQAENLPRFVTNQFHMRDSNKRVSEEKHPCKLLKIRRPLVGGAAFYVKKGVYSSICSLELSPATV